MNITEYIVRQIYELDFADKNLSTDIYIYGINTGVHILLNIAVTLAISLILNKVTVCFEFFLFFIPLRSTSGGFHFSSKHICTLVSTLIFFLILKYQNLIYRNLNLFFVFTAFCIILIIIIPVTGSRIRKLDSNEISNFQSKKIKLIFLYIISIFILALLNLKYYITPILSAIILIAILLVIDLLASKRLNFDNIFSNMKLFQ